jgi:TonB family protein
MLRQLAAICLAILAINQTGFSKERLFETRARNSTAETWVQFAPAGDEFMAMIPAAPTFRVFSANYLIRKDGEKVLEHREYSGYGDGLVFIIQSYKAKRPENLWSPLLENSNQSEVFERDFKLDDVVAKVYRSTYSKYPLRRIRFVAKQHVYFVTLATLEETNSALERFLASFRLRREADKVVESYSHDADAGSGEVFSPTEVTRKALVVWKSEPTYTEAARKHHLSGTVNIEAVFGASGYVTDIKVKKEMADGMTENAIEATRNIRFFPAIKDGKPVSQRIQLEYNFSLF